VSNDDYLSGRTGGAPPSGGSAFDDWQRGNAQRLNDQAAAASAASWNSASSATSWTASSAPTWAETQAGTAVGGGGVAAAGGSTLGASLRSLLVRTLIVLALSLYGAYVAQSEGPAGLQIVAASTLFIVPLWTAIFPVHGAATFGVGFAAYPLLLENLPPVTGLTPQAAALYGAVGLAALVCVPTFRLERVLGRQAWYRMPRHLLRLIALAVIAYSQLLRYEGHLLLDPPSVHLAAFRAYPLATAAVVLGTLVVAHFVLRWRH
jgi:hypothetical protein